MSGTVAAKCSGEKLFEVALTGREQQRQERSVYPPGIQGLNCSPDQSLHVYEVILGTSGSRSAKVAPDIMSGDAILWTCRIGQLEVEVAAM